LSTSADDLRAILEAGDLARALDCAAGLRATGKERALDVAIERCKAWCYGEWVPVEARGANKFTYEWHGSEEQRRAASLAALALGDADELATRLRAGKPAELRYGLEALPVLERFRPSWLEHGGAEVLFDAELFGFDVMMALRERGMCPQPRSERYAVALIGAPRRWYEGKTFLEVLDAHPRFRQEDLRLIFSVEGTSEFSLAGLDKYSGGSGGWSSILLTLLGRGEFSRAELLDTTLEVLSRGYPSFRAGWYSRFHEQLEPTLEERRARQTDYERLLGSAVPQTASFALKALEILQKKRALHADSFLEAVEPVLAAPQAETVKRALKMLDGLVKGAPQSGERVAALSLTALVHEEPAVQGAAVALFEKSGGGRHPELLERLRAAAPGLAPSVRSELEPRAHTSSPKESSPKEGPPKETSPKESSSDAVVWQRPDPFGNERTLSPPDTLEAALDCMSRAIEQENDAELFELALDAASRFADATHAELERLGGPLRKRAAQLLKRGPANGVLQYELVRVALAWVAKDANAHPHVGFDHGKVPRFAWQRTDALIERLVQGKAGSLFSAPSHQYGWISEEALSLRLEAHPGPVDIADAVLTLLRLPERAAAQFLPHLRERVGEGHAALESAARPLEPSRPRPRILRWGDKYVWHRVLIDVEPAPAVPDLAALPEVLLEALVQEKGAYGWDVWLPLAFPRGSEWVATVEALEYGGYRYDEAALPGELRCWRDPSVDPGPNAYWALAIALGARSPSISLSARDTLIAEIPSGRLRGDKLGAAFASLLPTGLVKVGRWTAHLKEVAAVSPLHTRTLWRALTSSLRGDSTLFPRDFGKLLGLLKELQIALSASCDDPDARVWLESVKRGGQIGKHAAALLG
jgi:hypothetical protein